MTIAARRTKFKVAAAAVSLLFTTGLAQAVSVQVNKNQNPEVCTQFLAALRKDNITSMTPRQLCSYDFVQRHSGSYYRGLDWMPVPGDPVALTMKIYDANLLSSKFSKGTSRSRAIFLAYAQRQNRYHALNVEIAPFTIYPGRNGTLIHGYVLRSRGSYCGKVSSDEVIRVSHAAGAEILSAAFAGQDLVAFFADETLQKPIADFGRNGFTKSFPVKVNDSAVVVGIDTITLTPTTFNQSGVVPGPSYSADIEAIQTFRGLPSQPHRLLVNGDPICDYRIYVKDRTK